MKASSPGDVLPERLVGDLLIGREQREGDRKIEADPGLAHIGMEYSIRVLH